MEYKSISPNVIGCSDFLPAEYCNKLYDELEANQHQFDIPHWRHKDGNMKGKQQYCRATDFWKSWDHNTHIDLPAIEGLREWFMHEGLFAFIRNDDNDVFNFLHERRFDHKIHIIAYNAEQYYNWHKDNEMFTFNLNISERCPLKGGSLLIQDNGTIEIPMQHNSLVLFPGYISHAVKRLTGKKQPFIKQRFSIQFWLRMKYA
jgi:hypothetical protein